MGGWKLIVDVLQLVMVGVLFIVLGWAAYERGKLHHRASAERRRVGLSRFTHRAPRIHLAIGALAACV